MNDNVNIKKNVNKDRSVLVAMSGGVDSAVTALLMAREGYRCMGATMMLRPYGADETSCCTERDIEDARRIAHLLGMNHKQINLSHDFEKCVVDPFVRAYEQGATPNPCILCNRLLKFNSLLNFASELGYDYVATGHYARIERDPVSGRYLLKKATDPTKDQSYVLYSLSQSQLSRAIFPLGAMTKAEVRELADRSGFAVTQKKESQDICFVPDGNYAEFIERYTGKSYPAGDFVKTDGTVLGRHKGIIRYTVGQRKGLGLALPAPLYVCRVEPESGMVVLGENTELFTREFDADNINLIASERITGSIRVKAKIRYRQTEQWATVTQTSEDRIHISFDEPQRAVTPGQAAVLYDGDTVVGGGTICRS